MTSQRCLVLVALVSLLTLVAACGSSTPTPRADNSQCTYTKGGPASKKVDLPPGNPASGAPKQVTIATDQGDIKVSLDADKAPCTVNSFLSLAKQGFFDNTPCPRLTVGGKVGLSVLQCGDPTGSGEGGPGYMFADELVANDPRTQPCLGQTDPQSGREYCVYPAGTLAMANGGPDTNGSQFFLVYRDSVLPEAYTVFGRMSAAGVQVVRKVAKAGTVPGSEKPKTQVTITSVQ